MRDIIYTVKSIIIIKKKNLQNHAKVSHQGLIYYLTQSKLCKNRE